MIKNYIKTAIRNIVKYKTFSVINIFGLSISLSISILLVMVVADQFSYDQYITNKDRIYRVNSVRLLNDNFLNQSGSSPIPLAAELKDHTGIESAVRLRKGFGNDWINIGQSENIPVSGFFADPEVLNFFEFELEQGNPKNALIDPNTVVLTKKAAKKIFGDTDVVGKIISVGNLGDYKVTGVLKPNIKSHIVFDALASMSSLNVLEKKKVMPTTGENWSNPASGWTYLLLKNEQPVSLIEEHINKLYKPHYEAMPDTEIKTKYFNLEFYLQSLTAIKTGPLIKNNIGPVLPRIFIYFLTGLALILILTSCINYTNLSMARSLTRAKEIGIRKVSGAQRSQIFFQFIIEAVALSLLAFLLSLVFLSFLKPAFQNLKFAQMLQWGTYSSFYVYMFSIGLCVLVGIIAGVFPALFLSSFQPIAVLKKLSHQKASKINIRKLLVVFQFCLSIIFIISVTLIYNQMQLMLNTNYGFDTTNLISIKKNATSLDQLEVELTGQSNVLSTSKVSHIPSTDISQITSVKTEQDLDNEFKILFFSVDPNYLGNMNIPLVAGSNFPKNVSNKNEQYIIINEKAVEFLKMETPNDALGKTIYVKDSIPLIVLGVVGDYNHEEMVYEIAPMALRYIPKMFSRLQVKLSDPEGIKTVESAWNKLNPDIKIEYRYLKEEIAETYELMFSDLAKIIGIVSFISISIASLGLLGMVAFNSQTRIKEISIRKIMGATNRSIIYLLSIGFLKLLLYAIVIGIPIAWFINDLWLQMIAYRVSLSPIVIGLSIFVTLIIGFLTVWSQSFRASKSNPIDTLRTE